MPLRRWSFSTNDLAPAGRVASWIENIGVGLVGIDIDPIGDETFHAGIDQFDVGPLGAHFLELSAHRASRTADLASRGAPAPMFIQQVRTRSAKFEQFGHAYILQPGDCALIDGREPYRLEYHGTNAALGLSFAPAWLSEWLPAGGQPGPQVWQSGSGWGGILAQSVSRLTPDGLSIASVDRAALLRSHLGSLISLALGERSAGGWDRDPTLAERLRDTIRTNYAQPSLSPAGVAAHHGVSVRSLHKALAEAGTSFGHETSARRLEGAMRLILDAGFNRLSIAEIAFRSGFANTSHFARRFRARYGASPSAARSQAQT